MLPWEGDKPAMTTSQETCPSACGARNLPGRGQRHDEKWFSVFLSSSRFGGWGFSILVTQSFSLQFFWQKQFREKNCVLFWREQWKKSKAPGCRWWNSHFIEATLWFPQGKRLFTPYSCSSRRLLQPGKI